MKYHAVRINRLRNGGDMTSRFVRFALCVFIILFITASAFAADDCDRACLKTMLDQYLNAVVKHDTSAAPLFVGFRQTDNGVVVRPGTGTWQSITALGDIQRKFFDPVSGQAAYLGLIKEGQATAIVTLRLRVENRQITEAEWVIARQGAMGPSGTAGGNLYNLAGFIAEPPPPERTVPQNQRASREVLIAIANSYFDGLTTHDGSIIMAHQGCTRNENGTHTAGPNPNAGAGGAPAAPAPRGGAGGFAPAQAPQRGGAAAPRGGAPGGGTSDCTSGLTNFNVALISARRYPVVDVEQQAVVGFGIFLRKPGTTLMRNLLAEWFFVDNNKIRNIWAAMFYPTNDLPVPNWPPYDGNFPVAAEFAAPAAPAPAGGRGARGQ
jgi:hypothetical protein